MRIAIDARLNAYRQGGISQYTRQLMTALADMAPDDQIVSFQHRDQLRPLVISPNVVRRAALTPPHHRFEQWTLPLEVLLARPDVLHCPDFIAPLRRPCPAVVTIHDLAFMHYPEILDASAKAYYGQVTVNAPRADAIIAVSEATRQDIAQFLDIPIEQIDVIHEAAAPLYTRLELREGEARVLNSTPVAAGTFMLFVSTLEPRKNLPTLLQALRICLDRQPDAGYKLVIVGRRGWRDETIFQTVRDLKLGDHVLFAGGIGQYDLRWLYNACRIYINPSLYEGFGLPLLEAMACGAPCLAAATSSLPEIGGDAAIYVPPLDAAQWADEISALWDDEERRAELGRIGMARSRQFSWLRAARETLKVYQRAAERIVPRSEAVPVQRPIPTPELATANLAELAAPRPGDPRPCLRCGTALVAGELQMGMLFRTAAAAQNGQSLAPQVWTCPRCGFTEFVAEIAQVSSAHASAHVGEHKPAQPLITPDAPIELAHAPDPSLLDVADAASANLSTSLDDDATLEYSDAVPSDAPEVEDATLEHSDEVPSDAPEVEDATLEHSDEVPSDAPEIELEAHASRLEDLPIEPAEAEAAAREHRSEALNGIHDVALEDHDILSAPSLSTDEVEQEHHTTLLDDVQTEPTEAVAVGAPEFDEASVHNGAGPLPSGALELLPESTTSTAPPPVQMPAASNHAAGNGAAAPQKPKPARSQHRAKPADPEPLAPQPAKRRQSRAKRKQTP